MESQDLRPLYLKRRLQLLQRQQNLCIEGPDQDPDQLVMRNKKYISLRVKLLKKQFGLPADIVSLRSLSLQSSTSSPSTLKSSTNQANATSEDHNYNGIHYVIQLDVPLAKKSRLLFRLIGGDQESLIFATSTGEVICHELRAPHTKKKFRVSSMPVTDFDINDSNDLMVAATQDCLVLFSLSAGGQELRRITPKEGYVTACRFLPKNSNLVICALSNGVLQVLNVSTGKFNSCSNMLGQTLAVTMNASGSVLWASNDRGCIESFRIDGSTGKLQKGCRVHTGLTVNSLTSRSKIDKLTRDPCLLATFEMSDQLGLYRITDDYGTVVPFKSFSSGSGSFLTCALMAPILSYRPGTLAVSGAEDGTLLFFDLERESRPCIHKLLGHPEAVSSLGFSSDESLLASADSKQIIIWRKS